jgi:hypothetical protein
MSWLLYPKNPTEEYRRALKENFGREDPEDTALPEFSDEFWRLLAYFFSHKGIYVGGFEYLDSNGNHKADINEAICQPIADWLEENGPITDAEQLPPPWRDDVAGTSNLLMRMMPLWRYSGGIVGARKSRS